jgi:hypothetical protein
MPHGIDSHKDTRQIKLHLETNVDVCTIYGWTPPESETTIWNLVKTRSLSISQLLVAHGLLKSGGLFPEQS